MTCHRPRFFDLAPTTGRLLCRLTGQNASIGWALWVATSNLLSPSGKKTAESRIGERPQRGSSELWPLRAVQKGPVCVPGDLRSSARPREVEAPSRNV